MNRRNFLKNLGVLLAATQLPTRLLDGIEVAADTIVVNEARWVTYSLGFTITREMLDDDLYGDRIEHMKQMAKAMRQHMFIPQSHPPTTEVEIDYED